jgi:anthranilate 1,2-dioxygenase large subunit
MQTKINWPRNDYSRIPFWLHHDEELYALEMERIFRGPTWNTSASRRRSQSGDYRTTWVGDTR